MHNSSHRILSYSVKHSYDVNGFLDSYARLLQKAIDIIWDNIRWTERRWKNYYVIRNRDKKIFKPYYTKRLIPMIPKSNAFKKSLRDALAREWSSTGYAAHYVDSAIKTAYSIIKSWRKNYLKGLRRRKKPTIKRRFIRIKETLYKFKNWRIVVTIKPRKLYLEFDLSRAWFRKRVEGCDLGELILKESELIITFRRPINNRKPQLRIGWDLNLFSLDGFSPKLGWFRIDLSELYHVHRVHETKRKRAQSIAFKKKSIEKIVSKHGERERNRARGIVHRITNDIASAFPNAVHGFEDLDKQGMFDKSRKHNRDISKQNWRQIINYMGYKARVVLVDPRNTSSSCPMCGEDMEKLRKGQEEKEEMLRCKECSLTLSRQLCGAMNVYLRMCGFPQRPSTFYHAVIKKMIPWLKVYMKPLGRVAAKGAEGSDKPPMNPGGGLSLMKPKRLIDLPKSMKVYQP